MAHIATRSLVIGLTILLPSFCQVTALAGQSELQSLKALYHRPSEIPFPTDNPYTPEKAALGKALFFEPRLSGAQNMTCASCHNPSFGWEVPVRTAVGAQNEPLARQAPTVLNTAWSHLLFWDGRAASPEQQARGPIEAAVEMNLPLSEAVRRLENVSDYKRWFSIVFPDKGVTEDTILQAIATYERTIVSGTSKFDEWIEGDENAISEAAKRGFELFNTKAQCAACHSGWNFTDNKFHDIGIETNDEGRAPFEPQNVKAQHAFKTPSLRDIALRGPYMHNGNVSTLEDVMMHYVSGGIDRPSRSELMQPVALTKDEVDDVIAFLNSLSATTEVVSLPVLPN